MSKYYIDFERPVGGKGIMVCPFRIKHVNHWDRKSDGKYYLDSQTESYPECLYDECPFYDSYSNECRSVEARFEQ